MASYLEKSMVDKLLVNLEVIKMTNELEKYFMVIAKCGHVGRKKYIPIKFAVNANSGKEAARIVRQFPRVKKDHKDAILDVKQVSYIEYLEIIETNHHDPYLKCISKYEQKLISNLVERLEVDLHNAKKVFDKQARRDRVEFKQRKYKVIERICSKEEYEYAY